MCVCVSDVFLGLNVDVSMRADITQQPPNSGVIKPAPKGVHAIKGNQRLVVGVCVRLQRLLYANHVFIFYCDLIFCSFSPCATVQNSEMQEE